MAVPHLNEDEIKKLALGISQGHYFCAYQAPAEMWSSIFLPVAFGLRDVAMEDLGMIVEEMNKAGHWAVNGYPTFLTCQLINREDWAAIVEKVEKIQADTKEALQ